MDLKYLVISDTHLGEDCSILSFPHGRHHLWKELRKAFGNANGDKFHVEKLILAGDIPDRTLSSTSQIITHTNDFSRTLGNVADIDNCIYIPGNHDHTIWSEYSRGITSPSGIPIIQNGQKINNNVDNILSIFFGFPDGSPWRNIQSNFSFYMANPIYAEEFRGRTYVFAHGTHFRKEVISAKWKFWLKVFDASQSDKILGTEVDTDFDINNATDMASLESILAGFVDSLWPSSKNNPKTKSDQLWYVYTKIRDYLDKNRVAPNNSSIYTFNELMINQPSEINILTVKDESIQRWKNYFLKHMESHLKQYNISTNNITFVYGDTHNGGWGEIPTSSCGSIRVYNCGGWVIYDRRNHPACHLFAVDSNGEEYLMDISYKNVKVEDRLLLDLAAEDAENRSLIL